MQQAVSHKIDRPFFITTFLLVIIGFFIFSSASLGLLSREGVRFSSVAVSQLVFGIGGGFLALFIFANISYRSYRAYAPHTFVVALFLTTLVFVPGLGYEANGAHRWISIFGQSLQPGEILKITFVLYLAWYYSLYHKKLHDIRYALGGFLGALGVSGILLLLQPDTGTFLILAVAGASVAFTAGVRIKHLALLVTFFLLGILVMVLSRPYLLDRVTTFMDPQSDPSGSGYQIKQSLIAVGSGGWFGRGYGQSVQKFTYLPEPIGDSVFSVAAEEFGFVGSIVLVGLFLTFALRGLLIASRAPDRFGGLTVIGIVILVVTQSYINIASMIGLMPLTGEPLTFISHGGTSLLFALAGVGIILNISRYKTARTKLI
jgi:cell division protein FtsW